MSYLNPVRLHFSGRFRADVSTINNETDRFNNATFQDKFQLPGSGENDRSNWQPAGTGAWRLLDCRVTRACHDGDSTAAAADIAVGFALLESGDRASAKIVDLDPDNQGVSMIFGLGVRLVDGQGRVALRGDFEPAAFFDLRMNRIPVPGPNGMSAYFQSILHNVAWGNIDASPCLIQMKERSSTGLLSIKFVTDLYQLGGQKRGYGRVVGTVGPYFDGEPHTFVLGRHLAPLNGQPVAHIDCSVDTNRRKIMVDVGNALPIDEETGDFKNLGELSLAAGPRSAATVLDTLQFASASKYTNSAGIFELPDERTLTDAELSIVAQQPLQLALKLGGATQSTVIASESEDGIYVRAEQFVFRLDAGESQSTDLVATQFGVPLVGATPLIRVGPLSLPETSPLPSVTTSSKTDSSGRAKLTVTAVDPKSPRKFIDGQVYYVLFGLEEAKVQPSDFDDTNIISLLIFDVSPDVPVPGWADVEPIFKQYSHLYPRPHGPDPYAPFADRPPSHPVVNLSDQASVAGFARHIIWALRLPMDHPSHMPVTRDLSRAKRALLLRWLHQIAGDGASTPSPEPVEALGASKRPEAAQRFATKAFTSKPYLLKHNPSDQA
jgi:hypothetical protein